MEKGSKKTITQTYETRLSDDFKLPRLEPNMKPMADQCKYAELLLFVFFKG